MKKTRFIALVLVAAVMMMGAGYAWWSDSVEVNNTVSTGELKVEFNNFKNGGIWDNSRTDLVEPYFTHKDHKTVSAKFTNLYPGCGRSVMSVGISNNGTIGTKLDNAKVSFVGQVPSNFKDLVKVEAILADMNYQPIKDENDKAMKTYGTLRSLEDTVERLFGDFEIRDGESYMLRIAYSLDKNANDDFEKQEVEANMTLNWKQFNK